MSGQIEQIRERVVGGRSSARAEVEAALERAKAASEYNVFTSLASELSLEKADKLDAQIRNGKPVGRLAGVPFAVKDNFLTLDSPTTAAAPILEGFISPIESTAVARLEAEGAIFIGKTNLDAFAHGGSTENSVYGPTLNANDKTKVAGGSSGGSAAAVALDIVPFSLGSDTGGSIRQPASFNGVLGVKPTYGLVSRYGVIAMASSTDVVGCFAKSVLDAETVLEIISGIDEKDMTSLPGSFKATTLDRPQKIGLIKEFMADGIDQSVKDCILQAVTKIKERGHQVEEVSLPMVDYALAMYYVIIPAEVSSNLARFDGIRYGKRFAKASDLNDIYLKTRSLGFMPENKRRIMIGSYVLSSGYYDAYYIKAQKARTLLIAEFESTFKSYDFLIGPVAPTSAFALGEVKNQDLIKTYLTDIMTVPASLAGLPALSFPAGEDDNGLPVGLQLIGPVKSDARLLAFAKTLEDNL